MKKVIKRAEKTSSSEGRNKNSQWRFLRGASLCNGFKGYWDNGAANSGYPLYLLLSFSPFWGKRKQKDAAPIRAACVFLISLICIALQSCDNTVKGCTDPNSPNYNSNAVANDGSCSYPSQTKKTVCFFFTDSDNGTCGTFGINLLDQVKATNPSNTFFISIHPNSTDALFAPSGIDIFSSFGVIGFPDFGVGDQANLLTQSNILNAISNENIETPQGSIDIDYSTTIDSIIVNIYGKFYVDDTASYFVAAYVVEDNIISPQIGQSPTYNHMHVLRTSSGTSGVGQLITPFPVTKNSFKFRVGIYRQPVWNMANIKVIGVLWRSNGSDFEFINAND